MKAEYSHKGENLDYINPTEETITAGTVVVLGEICGVAATMIEPGELGTLATVGVWTMEKDASEITAGAKVYYDAENDVVTATAATEKEVGETKENIQNTFVGYATKDASTDASTVDVRLNG